MKRKVITGKWFYYPQTDKWYRFIDTRMDGQLSCRVCQQADYPAGLDEDEANRLVREAMAGKREV